MTEKSPDDSQDLHSLISAANKQIEQTAGKQHSREPSATARLLAAHWPKIALILFAAATLFAQGNELRRQLFGVPQAAVQLQAESVLTAARAAVEQYRKTNGSLPDRVPLAALDAIVSMEHNDGSYKLSFALDGKTWHMDHQGTFSGRN